jgi:hypothetical protein
VVVNSVCVIIKCYRCVVLGKWLCVSESGSVRVTRTVALCYWVRRSCVVLNGGCVVLNPCCCLVHNSGCVVMDRGSCAVLEKWLCGCGLPFLRGTYQWLSGNGTRSLRGT